MSRKWQVQDAKARFSELLEMSQSEGPQIVTKRGVATAEVHRLIVVTLNTDDFAPFNVQTLNPIEKGPHLV